jgi:predicted N-acetyltransferase YhbS
VLFWTIFFMTDLVLSLRAEAAGDASTIDKLHERAFGPGRFARTAFRLREGKPPRLDLSFVAGVGTLIVGSVRLTPIRIGPAAALLLGPLTVDPAFEGRGIGSALISRSLDAARLAGDGIALLVGDEPYYKRFGFVRVPSGRLSMPGPVDPARLLWASLCDGATDTASGPVV